MEPKAGAWPTSSAMLIAGANPISISVNAVRVAITAFVIPFSFVFSGDLLLDGVWWRVVIGCVAAAAAVVFLCAGAEGYWRREIAWGKRLVLIVAGFGLLTPWNGARIAALALGAVVLFASLRPGREGTLEATLPRRP